MQITVDVTARDIDLDLSDVLDACTIDELVDAAIKHYGADEIDGALSDRGISTIFARKARTLTPKEKVLVSAMIDIMKGEK